MLLFSPAVWSREGPDAAPPWLAPCALGLDAQVTGVGATGRMLLLLDGPQQQGRHFQAPKSWADSGRWRLGTCSLDGLQSNPRKSPLQATQGSGASRPRAWPQPWDEEGRALPGPRGAPRRGHSWEKPPRDPISRPPRPVRLSAGTAWPHSWPWPITPAGSPGPCNPHVPRRHQPLQDSQLLFTKQRCSNAGLPGNHLSPDEYTWQRLI